METREATTAQSWCLIRIDTQPFAVALSAVAEIVEAEELVRLPLCSPRVRGLCTYRRDLLPVIALGRTPAVAAAPGAGRLVVLILRSEHGCWGIQIDRGVTIVAAGSLDEHCTSYVAPEEAVVIGSITHGLATYSVIDAEANLANRPRRDRERVQGRPWPGPAPRTMTDCRSFPQLVMRST